MSVATLNIDPAIERIWRENRCLKRSSIQMYRYRVQHFIDYCRARNLPESTQLTLAGVTAFSKWYARSQRIEFTQVFHVAHCALSTWAAARRTLGEELPPWSPATDPLSALSPLLREFAGHLREHRGNPPGTIHKKVTHVGKLLAFLSGHRRRPHQARLIDIDAFLIECREQYARATAADIACSVRSFMRFMLASGRMTADLAPAILGPIVRPAEPKCSRFHSSSPRIGNGQRVSGAPGV